VVGEKVWNHGMWPPYTICHGDILSGLWGETIIRRL
jgi:hypothetical protein